MSSRSLSYVGLMLLWAAGWSSENVVSAGAEKSPPRGPAQLAARLGQLREHYRPYLRSLPRPLAVRTRQTIDAGWRSRYEVERAADARRPQAPAWYAVDLDESDWQPTTVPEWRYREGEPRRPVSCILWYRTRFRARPAGPRQRVFLVFNGVDWEAEVWLNGHKLGSHRVYYEPFRFDVTGLMSKTNTLAVRVLDGPNYGEPAAFWSLFPLAPAEDQRYVRDRKKSLRGVGHGDLHIGSGYGIHREVYLETTGQAVVSRIFARGDPATGQVLVKVETDAAEPQRLTMQVRIVPENFEGRSYESDVAVKTGRGQQARTLTVPLPGAKVWTPDTPYLYRCRILMTDADRLVDADDVLFGQRSFAIVGGENPRQGFSEGTFLLNASPVYLRGTNVQGLNALWYWGDERTLIDVLLMLKAANFNAVRSCQHVQYPEVLELQDRLGILSQQDQGSRYPKLGAQTWPQLVESAAVLARRTYNHPGVVLLSYANETDFDPTELLEATRRVDPDRVIIPISGHPSGGTVTPNAGRAGYTLPDAMWSHVIDDVHPYLGWYGQQGQIWKWCQPLRPGRMVTVGEYGAEALDGYETMARHYPSHWPPTPKKDADALCGQVQVQKADVKQIVGFRGRKPGNLGEYIEASQTYQADVCSEVTKRWRLSPRRIAGYFHFHFIDVNPAEWPKSIVSHDLRPKKAYYEMAQINQPVVPLPRFVDRGAALELWVANDLTRDFGPCRVRWSVRHDGKTFTRGERPVRVRACDAVMAGKATLASVPPETDVVTVSLVLLDPSGRALSRYERDVFLKAWRLENGALGGNEGKSSAEP